MNMLEAVRGEIAALEGRLRKLREIERLVLELDDVAPALEERREKRETPAPRDYRRDAPRRAQGDSATKVLRAMLSVGAGKRQFTSQGLVEATGLTANQVKRALATLREQDRVISTGPPTNRRHRLAARAPHTEARARAETTMERNGADRDAAIARVKLRDRVMTAVASDPDALTDARLAQALGVDDEVVAQATGWLQERGMLALNDDGTWKRLR